MLAVAPMLVAAVEPMRCCACTVLVLPAAALASSSELLLQ